MVDEFSSFFVEYLRDALTMSSISDAEEIENSDSEYENVNQTQCCSDQSYSSHISTVNRMVNVLGDIFVTQEIKDVMRTVIKDHFVWNTGAKIKSVHYNLGEETTPGNYHICFAPLREVNNETVYVDILECLQIKPGHHFLHLGSGTGYLNTLAGLLIGCSGVNHGVEVNQSMLDYAEERQQAFRDHCPGLHLYDYCEPNFVLGDCLKLDPEIHLYDRIYCSGMLPEGYEHFLKLFLRPCAGLLMFPDTSPNKFTVIRRLGKTFVSLKRAAVANLKFYFFKKDLIPDDLTQLPSIKFPSLQSLCRGVIRDEIRLSPIPRSQRPQKRKTHIKEPQETKKQKVKQNGESESASSSTSFQNNSTPNLSLVEEEKIESPINSDHYKEHESDADDSLSLSSEHSSVKSFEQQQAYMSQDSQSSPDLVQPMNRRPAGASSSDSDNMDLFSDSSDHLDDLEDIFDLHGPPQICTECHVVMYTDKPKKTEPFNPNKSYPADHLNTKINSLPLPEHLLLYLKYRLDL